MTMTTQEQIEVLEEVLGMMDDIAPKLRSLGNERIDAYCLAAFEGSDGGWRGKFERDYIQAELDAARRALDEGGQEANEEGE